jgi:hypothetical protein
MKRRLIRESVSEEQQEQYLDMFASIPADERKRIKKAIKECLKTYGFSVGFLSGFSLLGIMVLVIGIKFKDTETAMAGFTMLAAGGVTLGTIQRVQILQCAAKKLGMELGDMLNQMKGDEQESSEVTTESKRVIKLTESELISLVKQVIKEEESANKGFTISQLYKQSKYSAKLPNRLVISSVKGKIKVDGVDKSFGSVNPTAKITCQGDCEITFKDIQDFGQMTISVKGGVPKLFVTTE